MERILWMDNKTNQAIQEHDNCKFIKDVRHRLNEYLFRNVMGTAMQPFLMYYPHFWDVIYFCGAVSSFFYLLIVSHVLPIFILKANKTKSKQHHKNQ